MKKSRYQRMWFVVALLVFGPVLMRGVIGLTSTPPAGLGARDGKLSVCPDSPNCVCSQADRPDQVVPPIVITGDHTVAWSQLREVLEQDFAARVISASDDYLHCEVRTKWCGFVDDVEFSLSADRQTIHVRSASRLGYSDLGVNRQRVTDIAARLAAKRSTNAP